MVLRYRFEDIEAQAASWELRADDQDEFPSPPWVVSLSIMCPSAITELWSRRLVRLNDISDQPTMD